MFGSKGDCFGHFNQPYGVAINHNNGNLVISEIGGNRIQIFSSRGEFLRAFNGDEGGPGGRLGSPCGLAIDKLGTIVVCDNIKFRVQIFSSEGEPLMMWGGTEGNEPGQFSYSKTPVIDAEGNIIIVEDGNCRLQIFG